MNKKKIREELEIMLQASSDPRLSYQDRLAAVRSLILALYNELDEPLLPAEKIVQREDDGYILFAK